VERMYGNRATTAGIAPSWPIGCGPACETKNRSRPISRVLSGAAIHLGSSSPTTSCDQPEDCAGRASSSYSVLLQAGFTVPRTVTGRAVRSYRTLSPLPDVSKHILGGLLSVALSVGSRPPGVTWRPALWSPDFPRYRTSGTATAWPTPNRGF